MTAPAVSPWRQAGPEVRSRRRRLLLALLIAFVLTTTFVGFPTGREMLTGWLLLTLLAAVGGDVRVWWRAVLRDWAPLLAVLFAYDLLRGVANEIGGALFGLPRWCSADTLAQCGPAGHLTARAHLTEPITFDSWLFQGQVPTVWLQEQLFTPGHAHWYDVVALPVYFSHFLASLAVAVALWATSYPLFRRYLGVLVALTVAVVATYVLYPMAPPWMASLNPSPLHGTHVHRVVQETLTTLGGAQVGSVVEQGAAYSNRVAAMPSLHAALPMMLLLFFWPVARRALRVLLVAYALAMGVVLVYGGEHYVLDIFAGWLYAAVVVLAARRITGPVTARLSPPSGAPPRP